jgi:hypothetical protein
MDKFLGVGLTNLTGIAIFTMLFIVMAKVVFIKYPIAGITDIVQTV